jgi:4-amino-4-deoxy-L-arabinose transferase-like glycosyltransferase
VVADDETHRPPRADAAAGSRALLLATAAALAAVVFRLWYAWLRPLVPDEAYYWSWTRHLAPGYFDHPPMIAYLMWASERLFGVSELGVRALGIGLIVATVAAVLRTGREIGVDRRGLLLLLAIWLTSPLLAGLATVMTPDTPAAFFATLALLAAVRISNKLERDEPVGSTWLLLGISGGLAMLSKYTAVLTAAAIAGAFFTHPRGRRALLSPGPYLAALVAAAAFSPVIYWNARHDWASFRFQLSHGLDEREARPVLGLLRYVGGQALLWTPVLFAVGAAAVAGCWRSYRQLPLAHRVLTWAATLPLAFFAYASLRTKGEEYWPDLTYFPMSVLTARYVSLAWDRRMPLARLGCIVALCAMLVIQFPEVLKAINVRLPVAMRNLFGWADMGAELGRARDAWQPDLIVSDELHDIGLIEFYTPGRPKVWQYRAPGRKPSAHQFFDGRADPRAAKRVMFVGDDWQDFCDEYGFTRVTRGFWVYRYGGRTPERSRVWSILEPKPSAARTTRAALPAEAR